MGGKKNLIFILVLLILILYSSFLTADVITFNPDNLFSRLVKYFTVVICFIFTLMIGKDCHDVLDKRLLQLAFVFHVSGDFCVSILGQFKVALLFFFIMQIIYIFRHKRGFKINKKEIISAILIYIPVSVTVAFISPMLLKAGIFLPVVLYAASFTTSAWIGIGTLWRGFYPKVTGIMIAIAFICLFFCDLNVGIYNSLNNINTSNIAVMHQSGYFSDIVKLITLHIKSFVGILIWLFYLPVVLLLSISGYRSSFISRIFPVLPDK